MSVRLTAIDIARAICIILVVTGHYLPDNSPQWYIIVNDIIYCFHMPVFMFISGYVYWNNRKPIPYKSFILKKFNRLMLPYFLVSIMVIIIKLITDKVLYVAHPVSLSAFYEMFYSPTAATHLWFIYVLFLVFLIIPFFHTEKRLNVILICSLLLLILPIPATEWLYLNQLKTYLFYFVFGCFVCQKAKGNNVFDKIPLWVAIGGFAGIYCMGKLYFTSLCLAILGIAFVMHISHRIEKTIRLRRFFMYIALYSYTIYLFHTAFEGFVKSILMKIPIHIASDFSFTGIAISVIIAGLLGPIALHKIAVKIKSRLQQQNLLKG